MVVTEEAIFAVAGKRSELHRDYCVRFPPGLYIASTHGRARRGLHFWDYSRSGQLSQGDQRRAFNSPDFSN
jgi:hypothetical protein